MFITPKKESQCKGTRCCIARCMQDRGYGKATPAPPYSAEARK